MPQHTRHSLIPFLLLWIAILSVVQVVFIVFFFTAGHHGLFQNSSAVAPGRSMQILASNTPSSVSDHGLILGKGKMLTFQVTKVKGKMKWSAKKADEDLISEEGGHFLRINRDGYFYLNLQGWIHTNTCSTGLLGKVEELSAGSSLEVDLPNTEDAINEFLTHLDIIYIYNN